MKHKFEIVRWANSPDGTGVWIMEKNIVGISWILSFNPSWNVQDIHVVNDEWSTLRMAQADGKQLQLLYGKVWKDANPRVHIHIPKYNDINKWRIKPEPEYEWQWMWKMIELDGVVYHLSDSFHKTKEEAVKACGVRNISKLDDTKRLVRDR